MKTHSLRESMPIVAAFVDECREILGVELVNDRIRRGLRGEPTFWAKENGHEIGTKQPPARHEVSVGQMVLQYPEKEEPKRGKSR